MKNYEPHVGDFPRCGFGCSVLSFIKLRKYPFLIHKPRITSAAQITLQRVSRMFFSTFIFIFFRVANENK